MKSRSTKCCSLIDRLVVHVTYTRDAQNAHDARDARRKAADSWAGQLTSHNVDLARSRRSRDVVILGVCSFNAESRDVRFSPDVGQIGAKLDKSGVISDQISVHFGSAFAEPKCTEIWSEIAPDFSNLAPIWPALGLNLTSMVVWWVRIIRGREATRQLFIHRGTSPWGSCDAPPWFSPAEYNYVKYFLVFPRWKMNGMIV